MKISAEDVERIGAVLDANTSSFVALARIAGLDPARDLRGANLRGVNFQTDDLAGFDFSRADLRGANLLRARGLHPDRFVDVRIDATTLLPPGLRSALDGARLGHPAWASAVGQDEFGRYADCTLPGTAIVQRLRWIPPGSFMMGSPEDEVGRDAGEGPRHAVTLAEGFWLFDTPCRQEFWQAVMGKNPSTFKGPMRPVETVSFNAVRGFLAQLNRLVPGLDLTLPSEAQWEYACRAGTDTATYAGDLTVSEQGVSPVLDRIAWSIDNSGRDANRRGEQAGTRPVGQKAANAWGLYDMLGNVWEWCADHWHRNYEGAPVDGRAWIDSATPPLERTARRVLRGGSWSVNARYVRSAYRDWNAPTLRDVDVGFRCARVQRAAGTAAGEAAPRMGRTPRERSEQGAATRPAQPSPVKPPRRKL